MDINSKREREKELVTEMIALYCHGNHGTAKVICAGSARN